MLLLCHGGRFPEPPATGKGKGYLKGDDALVTDLIVGPPIEPTASEQATFQTSGMSRSAGLVCARSR